MVVRRTGDYFTRLSVAELAYKSALVPKEVFSAVDALTLIFAVFVGKVFGPVPRRTKRYRTQPPLQALL